MPALDSDGLSRAESDDPSPTLLVSVRSEEEFNDAWIAGVPIIDWKEPRRGPLAPAAPELWRWAASSIEAPSPADGERSPLSGYVSRLSAALGESDQACRVARSLPPVFSFGKAGPSGCESEHALKKLWSDVRAALDRSITLVAVAYADHQAARCPPVDQVFRLASDLGIQHCLLDTFQKDGRSTIDHLGLKRLRELQSLVESHRLWWALAGSLRVDDVDRLGQHGIAPHCFGVRGDVCDGDRNGRLSAARIATWQSTLNANRPTPARSGSSNALRSYRSNRPPVPS
jgi:uncharacterized protein (UPF0264 family)